MNKALDVESSNKHDKYNAIPVVFCADCLSIKISTIDGMDYCEDCGSTHMKEANIFDWEKMYKAKYSNTFLEKK